MSFPSIVFDYKAFLPTLPELPGVYRMLAEEGGALYVGKAKNLKKRVSSYFQKTLASPRIAMMVSQIARIEITVTRSEAEALLLENNLIKSLSPRYNILFRDDKSYPYIVMSKDEFPRLGFFRGNPDRKADYFGPYPSSSAVRESLYLLQKMFRLRTCEDSVFANRSRPCLLHQIRRCSAPCVAGLVSREDYALDVKHAAWFLSGRHSEISAQLQQAMEAAAARLEFEWAALYRDQLQSLRQVQERQCIESHRGEDVDVIVATRAAGQLCVNLAMVRGGRHLGDRPLFPAHGGDFSPAEALAAFIAQHYSQHPAPARLLVSPLPDEPEETAAVLETATGRVVPIAEAHTRMHKAWVDMALQNATLAIAARNQGKAQQVERLEALRQALGLAEPPARIECFDISHTRGELPVASCVVYQDGGMKKSDYRRFNIRDIEPGDDYAAIRQAVGRRYAKLAESEGKMPDLLLIDGGKGQVAMAAAALAELGLSHLPVVGISKGEGRKIGLESLVFADGREALQLGSVETPLPPALRLVVEIRDEAHRFAITGHRARRGKARNSSRLDDIPGVGAARRKTLLARFGGLPGVVAATEEQLAQTPGVSPALAETIYRALH
ncbi:UvrABC system protein C [Betaproteobacteria bacterium]|nr:UvrABC system protein C [Betaproteobacteria bacterium]GHU40086.1 UvrABC system protein C [Betaproteobacteria bacterium]